jgi:hypothetical protein
MVSGEWSMANREPAAIYEKVNGLKAVSNRETANRDAARPLLNRKLLSYHTVPLSTLSTLLTSSFILLCHFFLVNLLTRQLTVDIQQPLRQLHMHLFLLLIYFKQKVFMHGDQGFLAF